jgi:hypothetical protein
MILPVSAGKVKRTLCKGCTAQQSNPCPPPRRGESKPEGADTMTAFDKKVNQIAARHGWNISPVSGWYIPAYSIVPMDRKERDQITAALNRCKSFHVDVLQAFSACAWTCTILIRDRAEWEALQKHQRTADLIRSAFIEAYHFNGHDDRGAVNAARQKAAELDALDIFSEIYSIPA